MGFVPVQMLPEGQIDLVISVRKDWPELVEILNKGLAAITREERVELYRRWFGQDYLNYIATGVTKLTAEERSWLAAHPVIRVGLDPYWAPVEFVDEAGVAQGISIAYLEHLEKSPSGRPATRPAGVRAPGWGWLSPRPWWRAWAGPSP